VRLRTRPMLAPGLDVQALATPKVKTRLCLERERMYASCAGGSGGYEASVKRSWWSFDGPPFRFFLHSLD
jgi:hypothetical protein